MTILGYYTIVMGTSGWVTIVIIMPLCGTAIRIRWG